VHRQPDPDWVLRPQVLAGLAVVAERGLTFDICAESLELLANVPRLAARLPALRLVLDHLGKPPIASGGWQPWADLFAEAARPDNVVAKLSGLNTAAAAGQRRSRDYQPYVDHALDVFGPIRLMYGGDWPFALQAADSYEEIWSALRGCLDGLSTTELDHVLAGTATRVYGLPSRG
jgi:L-fuconolactonase